eukprot:scaffold141829_cov52-Prasinocladus_malaysianus.AAC.1
MPAVSDENASNASANSLTCWFDCHFCGSSEHSLAAPAVLSTGPEAAPTHWGQQTFLLPPK